MNRGFIRSLCHCPGFILLGAAVLFAADVSRSNAVPHETAATKLQAQDAAKQKPKPAAPPQPAESAKPESKPATAEKTPAAKSEPAKREIFTAENNPTTKAGRGAPDLEKPQNPAAWVYFDGKAGKYKEENGQQLLQWFIEEPVSATPKFRVEAFEPLLGVPKDMKAVLRTVETPDSTESVYYGIAANDGKFEVGKEYSLLSPGDDFVIRNLTTGDVVKEIASLPPGKYAFAAGVKNSASGKESLAVTYFTVKNDK